MIFKGSKAEAVGIDAEEERHRKDDKVNEVESSDDMVLEQAKGKQEKIVLLF